MRDFVTRNVTTGSTVYTDGLKSFGLPSRICALGVREL
jgi:hypothetical protein